MASNAARRGDNWFNAILHQERYKFTDYEAKGRQAAKTIIDILSQYMSNDRYIIGGSVGKRTTPGAGYEPDFDVNPFFNLNDTSNAAIQVTIPALVNRIVNILRAHNYTVEKKGFAAQVEVSVQGTPISLDIVPAINLGKGDAQWHEVIRRYVAANSDLKFLSTSNAEKTVEYVAKQEVFVHDVVKLAKIWNEKCVKNPNYMAGRSTVVELVAVKAAQDEMAAMGAGNRTLTAALVRFFNYMKVDWRNLRIVFDKDIVLPTGAHDKYHSRKKESGVLIDPVNPYVNFLVDETVRSGWTYFRSAAIASLTEWDYFKHGEGNNYADRMIGM